MNVRVELRKHIGIGSSPLGPVEIEHDQWIVLAALNDDDPVRQVGYLPKRDGAPVLFLPHIREKLPSGIIESIELAALEERERM